MSTTEIPTSDDYPPEVFDLFVARGPGYVYRHENGSLHWKPLIVVDMDPFYFDSPFVKETWEYRP